jgi:hypothetical protein
MNISEIIIQVIVPSGIVSAIVGGFVVHFSNKQLDIQRRTMEIRKELYTKIVNQIALFLDTVDDKESDMARKDLLKFFREIQIWGSDNVVSNFKKLLDMMSPDNTCSQDSRNLQYKNFIISMRADILGNTCLNTRDIDIRG